MVSDNSSIKIRARKNRPSCPKEQSGRFSVQKTRGESERLFVVLLAVGSQFVNGLLLHRALGDARFLEERATTQLFQHAGALKFLLETLQSAVNRFVVFDLNDNHIRE